MVERKRNVDKRGRVQDSWKGVEERWSRGKEERKEENRKGGEKERGKG